MSDKWRYDDVYDDAVELTNILMGTEPLPKRPDPEDKPECDVHDFKHIKGGFRCRKCGKRLVSGHGDGAT